MRRFTCVTYGGLLEAGFAVKPIPETDDSTPDFEANADDGPIVVEVFAKHQDESETKVWEAIKAGQTPPEVDRHTIKGRHAKIESDH